MLTRQKYFCFQLFYFILRLLLLTFLLFLLTILDFTFSHMLKNKIVYSAFDSSLLQF